MNYTLVLKCISSCYWCVPLLIHLLFHWQSTNSKLWIPNVPLPPSKVNNLEAQKSQTNHSFFQDRADIHVARCTNIPRNLQVHPPRRHQPKIHIVRHKSMEFRLFNCTRPPLSRLQSRVYRSPLDGQIARGMGINSVSEMTPTIPESPRFGIPRDSCFEWDIDSCAMVIYNWINWTLEMFFFVCYVIMCEF